MAHLDDEMVQWAQKRQALYPYDPDAPTGAPEVIRSGKSEFIPNIDEELDDQIWITVVATRFDGKGVPRRTTTDQRSGRSTSERGRSDSSSGRREGSLPVVGGGDIPEFLS